ncbi:alpha/beta fold hydrolase [Streptococcus sp. H31]|uniref:alpha/beta fold hydrolase n=1 Tax=Streptococcus huangxiaojuni TaxID=3237239 RepID=UPI0034A5034F
MAFFYRKFAKNYKVLIFDHPNTIERSYQIQDMAQEIAYCLNKLNIHKIDAVGVSQGGMIAQSLAINYPDLIEHLVLVATTARNNMKQNDVINNWIALADKGDVKALLSNMIDNVYSKQYLKKHKLIHVALKYMVKVKDLERFSILAESCLTFDVYEQLSDIKSKTLVIGAMLDKVIPVEYSDELASRINCKKIIFKNSGHAIHQEISDFNKIILRFLLST